MSNWLIPALLALFFWGIWGFFPKLAMRHIDPNSVLVYQTLGSLALGLVLLTVFQFRPRFHPIGVGFSVLAGLAGLTGSIFFMLAMNRGRVSLVMAITALYPMLTIILAFVFLHEPVSLRQLVGFIFAITAILLITV